MTTRVLNPGDRFADWSWARNCWNGLAAVGVTGGSRYIDPTFSPQITSGKCISIPERDEFFSRGWGLLINWEAGAQDPLSGAALGAAHGARCLAILRTLEHPVNPLLKISVSCDTDARYRLSSVLAYYIAFRANVAEYGPQINGYGGSYELNALAYEGFGQGWLTTSHGWSDPAVWAAINAGRWDDPLLANICAFQTSQGSTSQWDMDVIIKPITVWTGLGADIVPDVVVPQPLDPPHAGANTMIRVLTVDDLAGKGTFTFDPTIGFKHLSGTVDAVFAGRLTDVNMDRAAVAEVAALYGVAIPPELV